MMLMCVGDNVRVGERPGSRLWWPPTQKSRFKVMRTYLQKMFASASAQWVACGATDAEESSQGDVHLCGEDVRFGDRPGGTSPWGSFGEPTVASAAERLGKQFRRA